MVGLLIDIDKINLTLYKAGMLVLFRTWVRLELAVTNLPANPLGLLAEHDSLPHYD